MSEDLQRAVGRVESKIDILLQMNKSHEERITSLETDRNRVKGAILGVGIGSGGFGAFLAKYLPWGGHG